MFCTRRVSCWVAWAIAIALSVGLVWTSSASAAPDVPKQLDGRYITKIATKKKVVMLTIDAGSNANALPSLLKTLKAEDVPASFFITGRWAQTYPGRVKKLAQRGYIVGNHTYNHPFVTKISSATLDKELSSTNSAIEKLTGQPSTPWFRFPYGAHRASDITRLNDRGYATIGWTVDAAGWLGTSGGMNVAKVTKRVMDAVTPGAIILMHAGSNPKDGTTLDADALPGIIKQIKERGYTFTTLDALTK